MFYVIALSKSVTFSSYCISTVSSYSVAHDILFLFVSFPDLLSLDTLPPLIPAVIWTRDDIREFKDSIRKTPESVLRVSSLSTATVSWKMCLPLLEEYFSVLWFQFSVFWCDSLIQITFLETELSHSSLSILSFVFIFQHCTNALHH